MPTSTEFLLAPSAAAFRNGGTIAITNSATMIALLLDMAVLTAQLHMSGGATNPFISLYLLQVVLGAILLSAAFAPKPFIHPTATGDWTKAYLEHGFPETKERLAMLHDALEVVSHMLEPGKDVHATYEGTHHSVRDARNVPKPIQKPRVPIMVGGNGPNVTWRLAARYADELNVDSALATDAACR